MPNVIGQLPEFTTDETVVKGQEEVKEVVEETPLKEKETPTEPPAEEEPAVPLKDTADTDNVAKQLQGLQDERQKLLTEIQQLRGQRREIKKEELVVVDSKLDELADVNPADVSLIEKVIKAKGYLTKGESNRLHYEAVKQDEVNAFLEKYPEYKPENDPHDLNWSALQREIAMYKMPEDPRKVGGILMRAHQGISKAPVDRNEAPIKRQAARVASVGAGGTQRSSSSQKSLTQEQRAIYERGGWSEEEIKKIESKL